MVLAAGGFPTARVGRARRIGFTLLEILLALALIGLLSASLITAGTHLIDSRPRTPEEVFWEATRTARRMALKTQTEITLGFDEKEKRFVITQGGGEQFFPVQGPRELTIDLLPARSTGGALLIGGQLVESERIESVFFYADGTCSPFRVQFRTTGPAKVIAIDPWTCAAMLVEEKS